MDNTNDLATTAQVQASEALAAPTPMDQDRRADAVEHDYRHPDILAALKLGEGPPGMVHNHLQESPDAIQKEMADVLGLNRTVVWAAKAALEAMRTGKPPESGSAAGYAGRQIRAFADRHSGRLFAPATNYLADLAERCEQVARAASEKRQAAAEEAAKRDPGVTGIYVYSYPHYINHPLVPAEDEFSSDRTLLKIGMSTVDAKQRVRRQVSTAMPEPEMLLRIYECKPSEVADMEMKIHLLMEAFDHHSPHRGQRGAGKEWYCTSLDALDDVAVVLGLECVHGNDDEDDEDEGFVED